jgi:hypothetical protein
MTRGRKANCETVIKRTDKAILVLRKSVIVSSREGWITREQMLSLNEHLMHLEKIFMVALPRTSPETESEAELPF